MYPKQTDVFGQVLITAQPIQPECLNFAMYEESEGRYSLMVNGITVYLGDKLPAYNAQQTVMRAILDGLRLLEQSRS